MEKDKLKKTLSVKVPHTFVIIFFLVLLMSILTWIVPSGKFEYESLEIEGVTRKLVVPNSFHMVNKSEANPAGLIDFMSSFHKGLIAAADIVMLIFIVNGAFGLVIKTGAIHGLLGGLLRKFHGKEKILIPLFFIVFALGSSLFGMLNEYNGLIPIFTGLGVALGYDAIVGLAIIGLGSYIGFVGSTMNPYTVVTSQSIAGVPIYSGMVFRIICFIIFCTISILWIFRYAIRVKKDPSYSFMYDEEMVFSFDRNELSKFEMNGKHKIILLIILASLVSIILGSVNYGWGTFELTAIFLLMGIASALIYGWNANKIAEEFLEGCKQVVYGALITGVARATLVIMEEGMIIDTVINFLASGLVDISTILGVQGMLIVQTLINFIIPSGSGQAATTIPILAPVGDVIGLSRQVVTLAFQFGDGLSNLLWPTCGVSVICGLSGVPIHKWWRFFVPLFGVLFVTQMILLAIAVVIGI